MQVARYFIQPQEIPTSDDEAVRYNFYQGLWGIRRYWKYLDLQSLDYIVQAMSEYFDLYLKFNPDSKRDSVQRDINKWLSCPLDEEK